MYLTFSLAEGFNLKIWRPTHCGINHSIFGFWPMTSSPKYSLRSSGVGFLLCMGQISYINNADSGATRLQSRKRYTWKTLMKQRYLQKVEVSLSRIFYFVLRKRLSLQHIMLMQWASEYMECIHLPLPAHLRSHSLLVRKLFAFPRQPP